jgi:hypothetical protein
MSCVVIFVVYNKFDAELARMRSNSIASRDGTHSRNATRCASSRI